MTIRFEERHSVTLECNGLKIFAILHLPYNRAGKVPCVICCNGFGGVKSAKYRLAVLQAEAFSKVGIATFRFDYRGTGDSEGAFSDLTVQGKIEDTAAALAYVLEHPAIDAARVAILGRSFGALVASTIAVDYSLKALALWAPVFDMKPWLDGSRTHSMVQKEKGAVFFGGHRLSDAFIKEFPSLSAGRSLEKVTALPLLLVHPGRDIVLGEYHFQKYCSLRDKVGAQTEILQLPESDHDFNVPKEQQLLIQKTTEWFATQLL